jgi:SnoaL-like domain
MDALLFNEYAVRAWMDTYRAARIERDPAKLVPLFTDDARYQERRHRPALEGIAAIGQHWRRVVEQQRDVVFSYDLLAVRANRAFVRWWAGFTWLPINRIVEIDAVSQIIFSDLPGASGLLASAWDEWIEMREI